MKYTTEKAAQIFGMVAAGGQKIKEICKTMGISRDTFYQWKAEKPGFAASLRQAEQERIDTTIREMKEERERRRLARNAAK